jgi:hypothetical protein
MALLTKNTSFGCCAVLGILTLAAGCGRDTEALKSGGANGAFGGHQSSGGASGSAQGGLSSSNGGSANAGGEIQAQGGVAGRSAATAGSGPDVSAGGVNPTGSGGNSSAAAGSNAFTPSGGAGGQGGSSAGGAAPSVGGSAGSLALGGTSTGGSSAGTAGRGGGTAGTSGNVGGMAGVAGTAGVAGSSWGPIAEVVDVGDTFSGQPTEMTLFTKDNQQFVGFWGPDRYMTAASRTLGSPTWTRVALSTQINWDAHHSVVLGADKLGYLHMSGGMHNNPLVYYRSSFPLDVTSFQQQSGMVSGATDESSCTYPHFFVGPIGDMVFNYRSGASGQGDTIFNVYNAGIKSWSRLLGTKLIDGQGINSAYIVGPTPGPDGYWHMVWTWRETADASTNHDLSYARTKDFQTWENSAGVTFTPPITLLTADIVDPVPVRGGMINNNTKVGFDSQNRPVVIYHKYDQNGNTQLYNARVEGGKWVQHQTTNWDYRWNVSGTNTLVFQIEVDGVKVHPDGKLKQIYYHQVYGGWGGFVLDETTLGIVQQILPPFPYPRELDQVVSTTTGMHTRWAADIGASPDPDVYYMMRWETLDPNGDKEVIPAPAPTKLRVYGFRRSVMATLE